MLQIFEDLPAELREGDELGSYGEDDSNSIKEKQRVIKALHREETAAKAKAIWAEISAKMRLCRNSSAISS